MTTQMQNKDGKWVPAEEEPYYSTFIEKVLCFIGYHRFRWWVDKPKEAKCLRCGISRYK